MDTLSLFVDNIRLRGGRFVDCTLRESGVLRMHTPGLAAFHVLRQGETWLLRNGQPPLRLGLGDIVMLPAGTDHRLQMQPETLPAGMVDPLQLADNCMGSAMELGQGAIVARTVTGHFRFDVELARPLTAALPSLVHMIAAGGRMPAWLEIGLQFLDQERSTARPAHQAIIDRMADVMFMYCLRDYVEQLGEDSGNWLLALKDPSLSAALSAMHKQPEHPWTVTELAEIASSSRSVFAERFSQVVGQSPLAYLTQHRMRLAAWQLRETAQPIYRIADTVGYSSEAAFSQAFKRFAGVSPTRYRKQPQAVNSA